MGEIFNLRVDYKYFFTKFHMVNCFLNVSRLLLPVEILWSGMICYSCCRPMS